MGDKGNRGATPDSRHRGEVGRRNPTAFQGVAQCIQESGERLTEQALQFGPGDPDVGAITRQVGGDRRGGLRGQPFLGQPAFLTQPHQRTHCGGAAGLRRRGRPDSGQNVVEQGLVGVIAGEIGVTHRLADDREVSPGVGQGDRTARGAEITQGHHSAVGQTRIGLKRGQCGGRVGDDQRRGAAGGQGRDAAQCPTQRPDGGGSPVRRNSHGHGAGRPPVISRAGHRLQCGGGQDLAPVGGAVLGHQRNGIAHSFHEATQDDPGRGEAGAGQLGVLRGHADLGRPTLPECENGTPADCLTAGSYRRQVGGADCQTQRLVAHRLTLAAVRANQQQSPNACP